VLRRRSNYGCSSHAKNYVTLRYGQSQYLPCCGWCIFAMPRDRKPSIFGFKSARLFFARCLPWDRITWTLLDMHLRCSAWSIVWSFDRCVSIGFAKGQENDWPFSSNVAKEDYGRRLIWGFLGKWFGTGHWGPLFQYLMRHSHTGKKLKSKCDFFP